MDYIPLLTTLLATVLYLNTLEANFAYDDSRAIQKNPDLLPSTPLWNLVYDDFWGTPLTHSGSHKSYRPLCVLTFRLNYLLGELNPWGYHLGNVLCHALTTFVFTALARILIGSQLGTFAAGLVFASHPIHTEAVAGVVGRADTLACLFFLFTLLCYMKYVEVRGSEKPGSKWLLAVAMMVLTAAAMLSKEQALTVLAVCAAYDVFVAHRASLKDVFTLRIIRAPEFRSALEGLGLLAICGSGLLGFRIYFMGNKPPEFAPSDNPASDSDSLITRTLTYNYLPSANFWMLLCPRILGFDWSMEAVPLLEDFSDLRNLSTVVFYSCIIYALYKISKTIEKEDDLDSSYGVKLDKRKIKNGYKPYVNGNGNESSHSQHAHTNGASVKSSKHSNGLSNSVAATSNGKSHHLQEANNNNNNNNNNNSSYHHSPSSFISIPIRSVDVTILSIAIIVFPFIPASNLFFYVGFVIAERILYIPSMGFCLLVGLGVELLYRRMEEDGAKKQMVISGLVMLVLAFSAKTVLRNRDWQTEERLYTAGIAVNPAKAWGNLANIFNDKQEVAKAEEAYRNALSHRPNMADVHYNLGILLQNQNRVKEAVESYQKAIHFRPKLTVAHLNLGILTAQLGDTELAKKIYSHCADLDTSGLKDPRLHDGTKISCLFNHGRILMDEDKSQEALECFNKALQRRPDHYAPQSIYNMIGEVYFKLDQLTEAEKWYKEALKAKPDHLPAHLTMSKLMQRKGMWAEGEKWLDKAKEFNPSDMTVEFHRAQLFASMGRLDDSIKVFEKILPHMGHDFDTVYNAANTYREAEKKEKAEELYNAAVKLKPNEPAAWMNLGAIYHINAKYDKAEQAYLKGLELRPNDRVTMENLQRLRNLKNKRG